MIISIEVDVILNNSNINHFRNFGYDNLKNSEKLIVPLVHLSKGSHSMVNVKCDVCHEISKMEYRSYLDITKYDGLYYCRKNKCFSEKVKKSSVDKYGVSSANKLEEKKDRIKITNLKKYGCENPFQNETIKEKIKQYYRDNFDGAEYNTQIKEVRDKNGWIPDDELSKFKLYYRLCRKYTLRNKKELLEKWDGYDYYDNEYIRSNFNLYCFNPNYPNIDHKISIKYGFLNNIDPKIISDLDNLCVTKLSINSSKREKNEKDYIKTLKFLNLKTH
jgi:hypothetical protein